LIDNTLVGQRPRYAQFSADGKLLWVSSEIGGTVAVIDVAKREVVKTIPFAVRGVNRDRVQPVGLKLTTDGKYAFVALGPANHIAVVDQKTYEVMSYVLVGRRVWHMALTPDEKLLLTTNGISNDVSVIEVPTLKAVKSIKVGRYPWGVAIKP
jgi:PQQ-dependent catabolism-associated beta-propeller protein